MFVKLKKKEFNLSLITFDMVITIAILIHLLTEYCFIGFLVGLRYITISKYLQVFKNNFDIVQFQLFDLALLLFNYLHYLTCIFSYLKSYSSSRYIGLICKFSFFFNYSDFSENEEQSNVLFLLLFANLILVLILVYIVTRFGSLMQNYWRDLDEFHFKLNAILRRFRFHKVP